MGVHMSAENSPAPAYKVFSDRTFLFSDPRLRGQDACCGLRRSSEMPLPRRSRASARRPQSPASSGLADSGGAPGAGPGGAAPRRALPSQAARAAGPRAPARSERRARAVGAGPRRSARWREARRDPAAAPAPRSPSPRGAGKLRAGKPRGRATSVARPRAGFAGGSTLGAFVSATRERRERRPPPQRAL